MNMQESSNNGFCSTMIFLLGLLIGSFVVSVEDSHWHTLFIIGVSTLTFHLSHRSKGWFRK
jgi:hypothetical protein